MSASLSNPTESCLRGEWVVPSPARQNGHSKVMKPEPRRETNRRGFFTGTLGLGLGLGTAGRLTLPGRAHADVAPLDPALTEYERILSQTDRLDILGVPRSWSVVRQGFHPFAPERIAVLPSGERLRHPTHNGRPRPWADTGA
jgi:hypothetical protein